MPSTEVSQPDTTHVGVVARRIENIGVLLFAHVLTTVGISHDGGQFLWLVFGLIVGGVGVLTALPVSAAPPRGGDPSPSV